jgi:hypothetical protein
MVLKVWRSSERDIHIHAVGRGASERLPELIQLRARGARLGPRLIRPLALRPRLRMHLLPALLGCFYGRPHLLLCTAGRGWQACVIGSVLGLDGLALAQRANDPPCVENYCSLGGYS